VAETEENRKRNYFGGNSNCCYFNENEKTREMKAERISPNGTLTAGVTGPPKRTSDIFVKYTCIIRAAEVRAA
jgi:hypothetical protein